MDCGKCTVKWCSSATEEILERNTLKHEEILFNVWQSRMASTRWSPPEEILDPTSVSSAGQLGSRKIAGFSIEKKADST